MTEENVFLFVPNLIGKLHPLFNSLSYPFLALAGNHQLVMVIKIFLIVDHQVTPELGWQFSHAFLCHPFPRPLFIATWSALSWMLLMDMLLEHWTKVILNYAITLVSCLLYFCLFYSTPSRYQVRCHVGSTNWSLRNGMFDDDALSILSILRIFLPDEHVRWYFHALASPSHVRCFESLCFI